MTASRNERCAATCLLPIAVAGSLCAASAAAHDPHECRTAMAQFAEHRKAFEENAAETGPIIERLSEAFDEATATGDPSRRHAVIYRHFVNEFPRMRPHLSTITGSAADAMAAAARAISCLAREESPP